MGRPVESSINLPVVSIWARAYRNRTALGLAALRHVRILLVRGIAYGLRSMGQVRGLGAHDNYLDGRDGSREHGPSGCSQERHQDQCLEVVVRSSDPHETTLQLESKWSNGPRICSAASG